jgi:hypothetical protein
MVLVHIAQTGLGLATDKKMVVKPEKLMDQRIYGQVLVLIPEVEQALRTTETPETSFQLDLNLR